MSFNATHAGADVPFELPREMQLVLDRAAEGELDASAAAELAQVAPFVSEAITAYDLAAAQLFLASVPSDASPVVPKSLEQRLQSAGKAWCAGARASQPAPVSAPPLVLRDSDLTLPGQDRAAADVPRMNSLRSVPWLAAAAGVALAAAAWWSPQRGVQLQSPVATLPAPSAKADPATQFAALATKPDAFKLTWSDWSDATVACEKPGVKGELVWVDGMQQGVMRFANLPELDASKERYQLWIIDSRGMEQRISGGVFNGSAGECYVAIDPGIEVDRAAAFAITIERPDGVWVSDMKRRVVIAAKS